MKSFLYLLTATILQTVAAKQAIFENSTIQTFICSRCKNNSQEAIGKDITNRLKTIDRYFDNIEDIKDIFCSDTRYKIVPVMKQITVDMKPCFVSANETYLPNFMYEGFAEFIEFLCGNRTIEIFFSDQGADCKNALYEYEDGIEFRNCSCEFLKTFNLEILTYEDLCFEIKSVEQCLGEALNHACPHFAAFRMLNFQFFHSVGKLCNAGAIFYINGILLMLILVTNLCHFNMLFTF